MTNKLYCRRYISSIEVVSRTHRAHIAEFDPILVEQTRLARIFEIMQVTNVFKKVKLKENSSEHDILDFPFLRLKQSLVKTKLSTISLVPVERVTSIF